MEPERSAYTGEDESVRNRLPKRNGNTKETPMRRFLQINSISFYNAFNLIFLLWGFPPMIIARNNESTFSAQ